jgi:partner of Y14 and mago protein
MSLPPLFPEQSPSGIIVDPQTLERVIPESKRNDGSCVTSPLSSSTRTNGPLSQRTRRSLKIRPGYTPQEDSRPFRVPLLEKPKGHKSAIPGSVPPSASAPPPRKSKNQKRREKKRGEKQPEEPVRADWEDDDGEKVLDGGNVGTPSEAIGNRGEKKAPGEDGGEVERGENEKRGEEEGEEEEKEEGEPSLPTLPAKTSRTTKLSAGDIADTLGKLRVQ